MIKRLFISQPMSDKSDEEIIAERERIIHKVEDIFPNDTIEVIPSFFKGQVQSIKPLQLLSKSLELLADADVAYFANGYDKYRGCRIEYLCANEYLNIVLMEEYYNQYKDEIDLRIGITGGEK